MKTKIITSGHKFLDIDAFACIFAYKELLDLKNEPNTAIFTAQLNASVTDRYKKLDFYQTALSQDDQENHTYIIMDVSDPHHFDTFVKEKNVSKIFDHHPGFETYWKDNIGDNAIIEPIGAAATLIYREFKKEQLLAKISPLSAELLAVAILSNTLDFQADITTEEDKNAYEDLIQYFAYTDTFAQDYFSEVQSDIEKDIAQSLIDDSKQINEELFIGQLEVWDATHILHTFPDEIKAFLHSAHSNISFLNLIELEKKRNIIICNDQTSLEYIQQYFPEFDYNNDQLVITTPHVILRKEILTRIYNKKY